MTSRWVVFQFFDSVVVISYGPEATTTSYASGSRDTTWVLSCEAGYTAGRVPFEEMAPLEVGYAVLHEKRRPRLYSIGPHTRPLYARQ